MSELQLLTAREFGFEGHKAVKDLHSLIIKPEVLKAWVEYEDGARPHLPVSFESQLDPNFEYNYALCTAAVKIFRIPRREVLYPGLADRKDLYDCQLRFIICFMDFATQPGELWEGRLVTQRCFRRALALLRFIEYEMSKRKAKCPSSTRKVMFKALKNYNVSLNVPHAKTLPASASVAAAQPQGIDEPVSTSMGKGSIHCTNFMTPALNSHRPLTNSPSSRWSAYSNSFFLFKYFEQWRGARALSLEY